jgi:two-component system OmpR family sensor kinase
MFLGLAGAAVGYFALRGILYGQLDGSLRRLAEIEAAATADSPDESVHFHEGLFVGASTSETVLTRFAQIWTVDGESLVRSRNLSGRDLPLDEDLRARVAAAGEAEFIGFEWDGRKYRGFVYPLDLIGSLHRSHVLQVVAPLDETQAVLGRSLRMLGVLVLLGTAAAYILGWWLAGHAVHPVMEIIKQAESLDVGGAEEESADRRIVAHAEADELSRLVLVLNSMLARMDSAFETQRRFLADAGHEIRTPLTVLRGDIEVALRKERTPEEYRAVLEQALDDLRDVSSLAEDLITLARSDSGGLKPQVAVVSLEETVGNVARKYTSAAANAGVGLHVQIEPGLTAPGDPALLERAVGNLVDNAISYSQSGGQVSLSAYQHDDGRIRVSVNDDGPGMTEEEKSRVFERFYRGEAGRRSASGSGLGLAIVKAIVESHGGTIDLVSEAGQGTNVSLLLPAGRAAGQLSSVAGSPPKVS